MRSDLSMALEIIRDKALKHVVRNDLDEAARRVADGHPEVLIDGWTESERVLIAAACIHMEDIANG